jgi:BTB/POZ domain
MIDPRSTDVNFLVGPKKRVRKANKFVLASHSVVFHRMFFTDFPSENEIAVPDADAGAFKVMLNCITGQEVLLDEENVAAVYYVAEKYDLQLLRQMCKTFVLSSVDSSNALTLLIAFHQYNISEINKECLCVILDDPNQFFKEPEFLEASADIVRRIFEASRINCSLGDLKNALSAWMTKKGLEYSDQDWFEAVKTHLRITRNQLESKKVRYGLFRKIDYAFTDNCVLETSETFESLGGPVYLHGFGLVLGMVAKESVEIEISTDKDSHVFKDTVVKEELNDKISIQDVFFEKIEILRGKLTMKIKFVGEATQRACVQYKQRDSFVVHLILSSVLPTQMCPDCENRQLESL